MQFKSMVVSNQEVSPGYHRIRLTAPHAILNAKPGQFVMVRVRDGIDPLLRRPFGIFDVGTFSSEYPNAPRQYYLDILYKVVGAGTAILSACIGNATERSSQESTAIQRRKNTASNAVPNTSLKFINPWSIAEIISLTFMAERSPISFIPFVRRISPTVPAVVASNMTTMVLSTLFTLFS